VIPGLRPYQEQFLTYAGAFLCGDKELDAPYQLKIQHTDRVMAHSLNFTCGLPDSIRFSAALSALYHDLGRFPQYKEHGSFHDDSTFNHALRSVEEIDRLNLLPPSLSYRKEIVTAICLHNQKKLNKPLTPQETFFYQLLRDCDKTDVLAVLKGHYRSAGDRNRYLTLGLSEKTTISPATINTLLSHQIIDMKDVRSVYDFKLLQISWIYDINFLESYLYILSRQDFQDILATIPAPLLPKGFIEQFPRILAEEQSKKKAIPDAAQAGGLL